MASAVAVRLRPSALMSLLGDVAQLGRAPRLQRGRCRFDSDRLHRSSLRGVQRQARARRMAEVRVRLLPEAPSHARSSVDKSAALRRQRSLVRLQPGVLLYADVAQTEERRSATPEGPVRSGSSACASPWCNGSTASSNLAGLGSIPSGFAFRIVAGRRGPVIW